MCWPTISIVVMHILAFRQVTKAMLSEGDRPPPVLMDAPPALSDAFFNPNSCRGLRKK